MIHPRLLKCSPSGYKFALTALCFGEEAPPNLPRGGLSSVVIVVKEVIVVKVICFVDSYHNFLYRGLSSVVIVVKEVIVVKVICFVDSYHNFLYRGLSSVVIVVKEVIVVKVICFVDSFRKHYVCI